jgi:hypothetical protein
LGVGGGLERLALAFVDEAVGVAVGIIRERGFAGGEKAGGKDREGQQTCDLPTMRGGMHGRIAPKVQHMA